MIRHRSTAAKQARICILRWWFHGPWHTNMGMSCDVLHTEKDKLMVFDLGSILSAACKLSFSFMANLPLPIWGLIKKGLDFADHGLVKTNACPILRIRGGLIVGRVTPEDCNFLKYFLVDLSSNQRTTLAMCVHILVLMKRAVPCLHPRRRAF